MAVLTVVLVHQRIGGNDIAGMAIITVVALDGGIGRGS
jgi:hypothetical protein